MILCGGAPGKRLALPSAKIMIHQGSAGTRGAPRDMEIQLREVLATTGGWPRSSRTTPGARSSRSSSDLDRDYFMTARGGEGLRPHRRDHRPPTRLCPSVAGPGRGRWPGSARGGGWAVTSSAPRRTATAPAGAVRFSALPQLVKRSRVHHVLRALRRGAAEFQGQGGVRRGHEEGGVAGDARLRSAGQSTFDADGLTAGHGGRAPSRLGCRWDRAGPGCRRG